MFTPRIKGKAYSLPLLYSGILHSVNYRERRYDDFIGVIIEGAEDRREDIVSLALRVNCFFRLRRVERTMQYRKNPLIPSNPREFIEYMRSNVELNPGTFFFVYDSERKLYPVLEGDSRGFYVLNL